MKVAISQSNFVPWRGYFDLIDDVDLFILFDDVAFSSKSWRSRNQIRTRHGLSWITIPVRKSWPRLPIDETQIDYSTNFAKRIIGQVEDAYRSAAYFDTYFPQFSETIFQEHSSISALNEAMLKWACNELSIVTPFLQARTLNVSGTGEDRVFGILAAVKANWLLNGPTARQYSTLERYAENNIKLSFKVYDYLPYPQIHGGFEPHVSILDLLFNCGPDSRKHLKSRIAEERAV